MYQYQYPRPSVSVDTVLYGVEAGRISVLLIERANPPFAGCWALPGGFVDQDEDLPVAAARELEEETCLSGIVLHQFGAYGKMGRDPRGHTITVAYFACIHKSSVNPVAADDAKNLRWFALTDLPALAFDHSEIIHDACAKIRERIHLGAWERLLPMASISDVEAINLLQIPE